MNLFLEAVLHSASAFIRNPLLPTAGIFQLGSELTFLKPFHLLAVVVQFLSQVRLFETLWTLTHQPPLFMGVPRQEYWSRLPFPSPGDLPDPGIKLLSPALAGGFFIAFTYYIPENTVWIVQSLKSCMSLYPGQRKAIQRPSAGLGMYIQ